MGELLRGYGTLRSTCHSGLRACGKSRAGLPTFHKHDPEQLPHPSWIQHAARQRACQRGKYPCFTGTTRDRKIYDGTASPVEWISTALRQPDLPGGTRWGSVDGRIPCWADQASGGYAAVFSCYG